MRYLQAFVFVLFLIIVLIFAVQNMPTVQVRFLQFEATMPKSLLAVGAYILGTVSGWSVYGFIKRSLHDVRGLRQGREDQS